MDQAFGAAGGVAADRSEATRAPDAAPKYVPAADLEKLADQLARADTLTRALGRPLIVLSYAQSLDGSIAGNDRAPLQLSGSESMLLTHRLRTLCDGILVGIGTVLADNPRLTARLVPGRNPQPIVLDTRLRTPPGAALIARRDRSPWIAGGGSLALEDAREALSRQGAQILSCRVAPDGRVDLPDLLEKLLVRGIRSVMVEGGARVITSFVAAGLVDQLVITLAPKLVGGLPALGPLAGTAPCCALTNIRYQRLGDDCIIWAAPRRGPA